MRAPWIPGVESLFGSLLRRAVSSTRYGYDRTLSWRAIVHLAQPLHQ